MPLPSCVVIMAWGQSNEQGSNLSNGAPIEAQDQDASGRIRAWRASDNTDIAAVQPLAGSLWISGTQQGPLRSFRLAQNLLPTTTGKIVIIPCAVGGAKLTGGPLGVGGANYTTAKARLTACLAAFPGARVILSWTQGEQDANEAVTQSAYIAAFTAMVADLRGVPGAAAMTAIIHQMVPERFFGGTADLPARIAIDGAHKRLPLTVPDSIFVPASFGTQIAGDPSHFTSAGHRTAGDRAFPALAAAASWQTVVPGVPAAPVVGAGRGVTITVPSPVPPAFVIERRAAGDTGAWTEQLAFPEVHVVPGATFDVTVEGNGDTDVRLRARSFAGTSGPSATVQIVAPVDAWYHPKATVHLDYQNDRAFVNGAEYASLAAARTAGAVVQTGGIDRVPVTPAASFALAGTGITAAAALTQNVPRYLAALDNGATGSGIDHLVLLSEAQSGVHPELFNIAMFRNSASQIPDIPSTATSKPTARDTAIRMAVRVKLNSTISSMDGITLGTDTACTVPTLTQLVVANRHDGTRAWGGTVHQVLFINEEITEAELNAALEPAAVPTISITSGSGYAGSTYTSTVAAQWTADGVDIPGEAGLTWVMTAAYEGAAIRCGASNTITMFTPASLGVNCSGWFVGSENVTGCNWCFRLSIFENAIILLFCRKQLDQGNQRR
ncbi:MAG: sialate O-acetylesterase [Cypionkella sp.]|nr:sialate O-acetylesterase [Cypionkella sp.]